MFSSLPCMLNRIIIASKEHGGKANVVLRKKYVGELRNILGQL
jgi:hypothetical protein